jgi:hypothetical protein
MQYSCELDNIYSLIQEILKKEKIIKISFTLLK